MANFTLDYTGEEVNGLLNKIDTAFGEEMVTLIDNQTVTLDGGEGFISETSIVEDGGIYTVIYNGVEYADLRTKAIDFGDGLIMYVLGNGDILEGGDNGMPFIIMSADGMTMVMDTAGGESCTVTVIKSEITKIPAKYFDSNLFIVDIAWVEDSDSYSANKTYNEIITAINSGKNVFVRGIYDGVLQSWNDSEIVFSSVMANSNNIVVSTHKINTDNEVEHNEKIINA